MIEITFWKIAFSITVVLCIIINESWYRLCCKMNNDWKQFCEKQVINTFQLVNKEKEEVIK